MLGGVLPRSASDRCLQEKVIEIGWLIRVEF